MFENDGGTIGPLLIKSSMNITLTGSVPYSSITIESGAHVTVGDNVLVGTITIDSSNANLEV